MKEFRFLAIKHGNRQVGQHSCRSIISNRRQAARTQECPQEDERLAEIAAALYVPGKETFSGFV